MKNFESWETQDIEMIFGVEQLYEMPILENWLGSSVSIDEHTRQNIEKLKMKIRNFADFWNEDELKLQGIAPLLEIVDYSIPNHRIFSQRNFSATIEGIEIGGRVDFMLAKGKQKPIKPFFFIHEYKQERKGGDTDPKGQLLAELLVAQAKNEDGNPLYGAYVLGRHWFFVVLQGKKYAVSNAFNASDEDIYQIIAILRKIKEYIVAMS